MNKKRNIEIIFNLTSPLSHIGETESTHSFLNTVKLLSDGKVEECFVYSANAIRGKLRDMAAKYLLDRYGKKVSLDAFHVLFSGGNISGTLRTDIEQARRVREKLPMVSLFGGGIGNQILEGKMNVGFAYPVCSETADIIPQDVKEIDYSHQEISQRLLTEEIAFTRTDDSKNEMSVYLDNIEDAGEKKKDSATTQMRYNVEYIIPNAQLYCRIDLECTDIEFGAFLSALQEWANTSTLGGMASKGFGFFNAKILHDGILLGTMDGNRLTFDHPFYQEFLKAYDEIISQLEGIEDVLAVSGQEKKKKEKKNDKENDSAVEDNM